MKKKILTLILLLICLTACKTKTYTVTFETDEGTVLESFEIKKGSTIEDINPPEKEGYIFVKWLKEGIEYDEDTPITDDITLTAIWIETPELAKQYTVTFNIDGTIKTKTVKEQETVEKPKDPTKEDYKFIGWYIGETPYDFDTPIEKDIVIVAKFEQQKIMINFDLKGGSGITTKAINRGDTLEVSQKPTKIGYNFVMWTLNGKYFPLDTKIEEDLNLVAVWEKIEYVLVEFKTNGGSQIDPQIIQKGTTLSEIKTPTKEGYTFKNWSLNGKTFDINSEVKEDIILTAVWIEDIEIEKEDIENSNETTETPSSE